MTTPQHTHICVCHHGRIAHRYLLGTKANDGECLAPQCWCGTYEEDN